MAEPRSAPRSLLALVVVALGAILVLAGVLCAVSGVFVCMPQLLLGGLLLMAGVILERWRYKSLVHAAPDPAWRANGERFVDPSSGALVAVYDDPRTGRRHYVVVSASESAGPPPVAHEDEMR